MGPAAGRRNLRPDSAAETTIGHVTGACRGAHQGVRPGDRRHPPLHSFQYDSRSPMSASWVPSPGSTVPAHSLRPTFAFSAPGLACVISLVLAHSSTSTNYTRPDALPRTPWHVPFDHLQLILLWFWFWFAG